MLFTIKLQGKKMDLDNSKSLNHVFVYLHASFYSATALAQIS